MTLTVAAIVVAYLLGSVPTGLWLGLSLRKVDIREHGSNNIGATNTLRVLGKKLGVVALVGDIVKGALPVLAAARWIEWEHAPVACGLAAIVGHTWPLYLRFKGGKGVATSAGVFLTLTPVAMLIAAAAFVAVFLATRMVSAGSVTAALALLIAVNLMSENVILRIFATIVAAIVILRHRSNIRRILAGTENKI